MARDLANRIADKLKLNEYKRLQLKSDLDSAEMTLSPEQYVANAVVKALFIGIFAIPFLFFVPILSLLIAVIAVVIYFTEYKKVGKIIPLSVENAKGSNTNCLAWSQASIRH